MEKIRGTQFTFPDNDVTKPPIAEPFEEDVDEIHEIFGKPNERVVKIASLLVMAGARPLLGKGKHDELIFGYEEILENGQSAMKEFTVTGSLAKDQKELDKLLFRIDSTFGFNNKKPDGEPASLEDRFIQLEDDLLHERFRGCNDVKEEYRPHVGHEIKADWIASLEQRFNQDGGFSLADSVAAGNTDARILGNGGQNSLDLAIKTRGFIAKISQAAMLSKPSLAIYVNKDPYNNSLNDIDEFVDRRLINLSKRARVEKFRPKFDGEREI